MATKSEEITDIIEQLKSRYTDENFKKMGIKVGKVLTFGTNENPTILEITKIAKGRYWAKHVQLHEKSSVISHYRHNVDATEEAEREYGSPYCTDCEVPVSEIATPQGKQKFEARKEQYLSDGTFIGENENEL